MQYFRKVKSITRVDRNDTVREEVNVKPILAKIQAIQLRGLGHLVRMEVKDRLKEYGKQER